MEQGGETPEGVGVFLDAIQEFLGGHIILERERQEVAPFLILAETIGDDDLLDAALIERVNEGAADKASGASDEHPGLGMEQGIGRVEFFFSVVARQGGAKRARGGFEGWVVFGHK